MIKKILHITNNDYDGAGRAVIRLNNALIDKGIRSNIFVVYKKTDNNNVITYGTGKTFKELLKYIINNYFLCNINIYKEIIIKFFFRVKQKILLIKYKPKNLFNFNICIYNFEIVKPYLKDIDLLVLHSIQEMISVSDIVRFEKKLGLKIVFHPLDMEMLTGGYHFSYDCKCYEKGVCNSANHNMHDRAETAYRNKINMLSEISITWIATNNFILERIMRSKVYSENHKSKVIFMGISEDIYKTQSRKNARDQLSIDIHKKTILFGCFNFKDKRKGADLLINLVNEIKKSDILLNNITILTYGDLNGFDLKLDKTQWKHFGYVNSSYKMNLLYQSSDIMINPSIDDMGPTTMQEALLNNIYIISYKMGLAQDLIIEKVNGNIVNDFNEQDFIDKVINRLNNINDKSYLNDKRIIKIKNFIKSDYEANEFSKLIN